MVPPGDDKRFQGAVAHLDADGEDVVRMAIGDKACFKALLDG